MGKKRKKASTSSSSSSDSEPAPKKKAAPTGPRFNVADSDSDDAKPNAKAVGISEASAADSFNKKQWEIMARLKVDYQKQTDKKAKKDEKKIKKDQKKMAKKEKKRAKKLAEEEEARRLAEEEEAEAERAAREAEAKEVKKKEADQIMKKGPSMPGQAARSVGDVQYSDSVGIGQFHPAHSHS
mmetsp:Transcript_158754/g.280453  ORF Transcript_158754/g.280453 Transcript_158754/m.280453 type:complete len:183 (+) Transcript_158754:117-665(+)